MFLILSVVYHKLCFSTLTNPSDLYRRKRSWNWNMFMIEQSKHLKGQLDPPLVTWRFLDQRRSVGPPREWQNAPKCTWLNWILAQRSESRPCRPKAGFGLVCSNNCSSMSSTLFPMLRSSQNFTTMMLNRSDLAENYIELPTCGTRQPNSTQPLRFGNLAITITYHGHHL